MYFYLLTNKIIIANIVLLVVQLEVLFYSNISNIIRATNSIWCRINYIIITITIMIYLICCLINCVIITDVLLLIEPVIFVLLL